MSTHKTMTAHGRITVVQEERFRLVTDGGQGLLLTLARDASADPRDLCNWQSAGTPVRVEYTGEPDLASGVATEVKQDKG